MVSQCSVKQKVVTPHWLSPLHFQGRQNQVSKVVPGGFYCIFILVMRYTFSSLIFKVGKMVLLLIQLPAYVDI